MENIDKGGVHELKELTIKDLKDIIDRTNENDLNARVVITLDEPSIGGRAFTSIIMAHMGFDWENNQFRIEPKEPIARNKFSRDTPRDIRKWRDGYFCPKCDDSLMKKEVKESRYCRRCGQRFSGLVHDYDK